MSFCGDCGSPRTSGDRFCKVCGKSFIDDPHYSARSTANYGSNNNTLVVGASNSGSSRSSTTSQYGSILEPQILDSINNSNRSTTIMNNNGNSNSIGGQSNRSSSAPSHQYDDITTCGKCRTPITAGNKTSALGKQYHEQCFR